MQYKCQECNDTGSRDKLGTYLDCNACGIAATRRDLNDFVKSLGPTHPEDVALAIHQRALSMAPKQEAPKGTLPKWIDDQKGKDPGMDDLIEHMEMIYANYIALAVPAAANGAPEGYVMVPLKPTPAMIKAMAESRATDDEGDFPLMIDLLDFGGENKAFTVLEAAYVAAVGLWPTLAAAGPDAALVKALGGALAVIDDYLAYTHDGDPWKEDARAMGEMDINDAENDGRIESWRAALSGAKGN